MDVKKLHQLAYNSLLKLSHENGFRASARHEAYGCTFGRDSAISILKILRAHTKKPLPTLLPICRKNLLHLINLQGKKFNLESGEQPGKFIHEFRDSNFDHLVLGKRPWFIYPEGVLKNYDSLDSTPLILIAIFRYWETTQDNEFLITALPAVEDGLNWIITFGDPDKDLFIEYDFPHHRSFGGLGVQSWTDSHESIRDKDGRMPKYPIAPIEAQAFVWLALKLWADFYTSHSPKFAKKLSQRARQIKDRFNKKFILVDHSLFFGAQALDGNKAQVKTVTANPLICLWAAHKSNDQTESVLNDAFIKDFIKRGFMDDLFLEDAGIRTMSTDSQTFNSHQSCYHNGSFWPMLNGLIIEGLENFGFTDQSSRLKEASLLSLVHFNCPIELYIKNDQGYLEYRSPSGQNGCRHQAWSAAALLDMTT